MFGYVSTGKTNGYATLRLAVREMPDPRRNDDTDTTGEGVLAEFAKKIISNQTDCPPDFSKVVDKYFWELI
jgi:hypothetical protein